MHRWVLGIVGAVLLLAIQGVQALQSANPENAEAWVAQDEQRILLKFREGALPTLRCEEKLNGFNGPFVRGKVSVVVFWAPWCGPCKPVLDALGALASAGQGDVQVITVAQANLDPKQADVAGVPRVKAILQEHKLSAPTCVYEDQDQQFAWEAGGIPKLFLFDRDGRVARVSSGGDRGTALVNLLKSGWRP